MNNEKKVKEKPKSYCCKSTIVAEFMGAGFMHVCSNCGKLQ